MATRITDGTIRNLKPEPGKRLEIGDILVTGLRIRATWAENVVRRVWYFSYRHRGSGALVPMRLGEYPATQLREARDIALNHRRQLDQGMDPRDVERALRAISQSSKAYSVAMLADDFLTNAQRNKAPKTFRHYRRYLEIVKARWGDRNAAEIRRGDVIDLLDRQSEKGYRSAGHLLSASRAAWSYAIEREKIEITPWAGLKRQTRAYKARTKDRALSDAELREMLLALPDSGIPKPSQLVLHLILWTGCRPGEVCGGEWREIDLSESIWAIRAPRTKGRKPHTVMLPTQATAALQTQKSGRRRHVFPTPNGCLNTTLVNEQLRRVTKAGSLHVAAFQLHDLRRSTATGLARLGVWSERP